MLSREGRAEARQAQRSGRPAHELRDQPLVGRSVVRVTFIVRDQLGEVDLRARTRVREDRRDTERGCRALTSRSVVPVAAAWSSSAVSSSSSMGRSRVALELHEERACEVALRGAVSRSPVATGASTPPRLAAPGRCARPPLPRPLRIARAALARRRTWFWRGREGAAGVSDGTGREGSSSTKARRTGSGIARRLGRRGA